MKTLLVQILTLISFASFGQGVDSLDYEIKTIDSKHLDDERTLKVYLPKNYTPKDRYPVIYMTDGSSQNFEVAKGYINALSLSDFNIIPPSILVGIVHKKRNEELKNIKSGEYFTEYLFQEVIQFIDSTYCTSGFNVMIGHSNGAEYNHKLLMREGNPFNGFITLSTYFQKNDPNRNRLSEFFENYQGRTIYYFVANGTKDAPSRFQAGNVLDSLYQNSPNQAIKFMKKEYEANHLTIVPHALLDGLKFIFQDYNNLENYASIVEYDEYYLTDLKKNYGLTGSFSMQDLDGYLSSIIQRKDKEEFKYFLDFVEKHKLWFGGGLDHVNIGNQYFAMEMYPEAIESYNMAIEDSEKTDDRVFYYNIHRPVKSYVIEGRKDEVVDFLEKSREILPEEYYLRMSYRIAKFAIENEVSVKKGRNALEYCKANYKKNSLFTREDLAHLEKK
ncbi:hypothetical protein G3567_13160 [Psychroflexus sp. YR1-1]|uniref:Esterase n=1 Tax=Psychroflexus aurantiacus TaxID=2709310 RepID=A0A6B3R796_9FLAO|nr:alpha/beta hydrolase-fold protein [Psychroflexus aurantiacus]NEV95085.1 hypothetical protein [Psychroflexus aurantiacus]